jgi:small conductance mechanosensitive channel
MDAWIQQELITYLEQNLPMILEAVATIIVGILLARLVRSTIAKVLKKAKVDRTIIQFVSNSVYSFALIFVFIAFLNKLGVQTTSIAAVLGAASVAIGLSFQNSLSNFSAGLLIIVLRPFKVGDTIECAGCKGVVKEVNMVTITLVLENGSQAIIPNSKVISDKIIKHKAVS